MNNVKKKVTTLWAGRAWIHAKYLNLANVNQVPLIIDYKGTKMTVPASELKARFDRHKIVDDKFKAGVTHKQYGIIWEPEKTS